MEEKKREGEVALMTSQSCWATNTTSGRDWSNTTRVTSGCTSPQLDITNKNFVLMNINYRFLAQKA